MVASSPAMTDTQARPAIITPQGGVRCWCCGSRFANLITAPYDFSCRHCKAKNVDKTVTTA